MVLVLNVFGRAGGDIWTMTKGDVNGSFLQTGRQDRLNGVRFELPGLAYFFGLHFFFYLYAGLRVTSRGIKLAVFCPSCLF